MSRNYSQPQFLRHLNTHTQTQLHVMQRFKSTLTMGLATLKYSESFRLTNRKSEVKKGEIMRERERERGTERGT